MSRRSRKSQSLSQSSSRLSQTQTRLDQHFSQLSIEDQVNNCVRYFIYNAGQNVFFRKAEVQKICAPKGGQLFQQVIEKAASILENVYGYKLLVCDQSANTPKAYIVSNALPYKNYNVDRNANDDKEVRKILLLLVLSHIFMSNFSILEASLYSFLKNFQIDVNVRHPVFGNVKDYLTVLIKQKYLAVETDPVTKKVSYAWGARAEKEISKHDILNFVCKMYQDRQPQTWTHQFQAANEQGFENERDNTENAMDVDTEE